MQLYQLIVAFCSKGIPSLTAFTTISLSLFTAMYWFDSLKQKTSPFQRPMQLSWGQQQLGQGKVTGGNEVGGLGAKLLGKFLGPCFYFGFEWISQDNSLQRPNRLRFFYPFQVMWPYHWEVLVLFHILHSWHNFARHEVCQRKQKKFYQEIHHMTWNGCKKTLAD